MKALSELLAAFLDLPTWIAIAIIAGPILSTAAICFLVSRFSYRSGRRDAEEEGLAYFKKHDRTIRL